ncbi:hypothetical protein V499_01229 [Pseudogymnoascus sp. VKM F-103]|nr:hypothetical protein V499_01229 [Pseudogymnoascus sp. VKM F-103]
MSHENAFVYAKETWVLLSVSESGGSYYAGQILCIAKAVQCQYPASTPRSTGQKIRHGDNEPIARRTTVHSLVAGSPSAENSQEASNDGDIILDSAPVILDPALADIGGDYLDWDNPQMNFTDFLDPPLNVGTIHYPPSGSSPSVHHWIPSSSQALHIPQSTLSSYMSIPKQPSTTIRSIIRRPKVSTGAQRTANLILHTLKSYPLMMMRHGSLPPFIHPRLISSETENDNMEPLTNCICLMHMISSGVRGGRKLFWKNVQMECERLCEESLKLNKWELLAGMQALFIYILTRLDEGETEHNNLDSLLLSTVTVLSKRLTHSDITIDTRQALRGAGSEIIWEDWLFEESRRRLDSYLLYYNGQSRVGHPNELATKTPKRVNLTKVNMPQPTQAQSSNQEGRILLAIQALKEHQFKSVRAAALSYDVSRSTLTNRMNGMTSRRDSTPNISLEQHYVDEFKE